MLLSATCPKTFKRSFRVSSTHVKSPPTISHTKRCWQHGKRWSRRYNHFALIPTASLLKPGRNSVCVVSVIEQCIAHQSVRKGTSIAFCIYIGRATQDSIGIGNGATSIAAFDSNTTAYLPPWSLGGAFTCACMIYCPIPAKTLEYVGGV